MGRVLTVSRVAVRPEQEKEYLATVQALADHLLKEFAAVKGGTA